MDKEDKRQKLEEIARRVADCTRCNLYKLATNPVPGRGNPEAEVIFIGEGPGYHEDKKGVPFCGASGRLLDQLIHSIGLAREEVFIGNVVKHRCPDNRDPQAEEIEACRPFLDEQITIVDPKIIVTLGRFSMDKFLPGEKISRIHGQARFADFNGRRLIVIPMYHPAAALRSGKITGEIKSDFQKIRQFLDESEEAKEPKEAKEEQMSLL